jgi:hypothetical protein
MLNDKDRTIEREERKEDSGIRSIMTDRRSWKMRNKYNAK